MNDPSDGVWFVLLHTRALCSGVEYVKHMGYVRRSLAPTREDAIREFRAGIVEDPHQPIVGAMTGLISETETHRL